MCLLLPNCSLYYCLCFQSFSFSHHDSGWVGKYKSTKMRASMKRAANPIIAPVYHLLVWLENPFCFLFKEINLLIHGFCGVSSVSCFRIGELWGIVQLKNWACVVFAGEVKTEDDVPTSLDKVVDCMTSLIRVAHPHDVIVQGKDFVHVILHALSPGFSWTGFLSALFFKFF